VYDSANVWVRNIHIIDCHSGVFTGGTEFVSGAACLLLPACLLLQFILHSALCCCLGGDVM